jgi:hypothetical protein
MKQKSLPTLLQGSRIVFSRQTAHIIVPGLKRDWVKADEKITVCRSSSEISVYANADRRIWPKKSIGFPPQSIPCCFVRVANIRASRDYPPINPFSSLFLYTSNHTYNITEEIRYFNTIFQLRNVTACHYHLSNNCKDVVLINIILG